MDKTLSLMNVQEAAKTKIQQIDEQIIEEYIKQNKFFGVTNELGKLNDQKPEYLKQFYEYAKKMQISLSEEEVNSKIEYEASRLDIKLWTMLEKERKKKQAQQNTKKAKGTD